MVKEETDAEAAASDAMEDVDVDDGTSVSCDEARINRLHITSGIPCVEYWLRSSVSWSILSRSLKESLVKYIFYGWCKRMCHGKGGEEMKRAGVKCNKEQKGDTREVKREKNENSYNGDKSYRHTKVERCRKVLPQVKKEKRK